MMTKQELLQKITDYYLSSGDFNGLPVRTVEISIDDLKEILVELIEDGDISIRLGEGMDNPYVKRLKSPSKEKQIKSLQEIDDTTHVVAYPEGDKLKKAVISQKYRGKPYKLAVAKGVPVLECAYFKLEVLEKFRNDPRYHYRINDIVGAIYSLDDKGMGKKDELYLQSVGFGYDKDMNRVVCTFYTDLMNLDKDLQQYWKYHELKGDYKPHPDYVWSQVYGQWPEKASLPEAFTAELKAINDITIDAYGKKLFKADYWDEKRPKELGFLIRPTAKEFDAFMHILDKLISENIDKKFFKGLVDPNIEEVRKDGKIIVRQKGSLLILEEHIHEWFTPREGNDSKLIDKMFETFRDIRKLRTQPAHTIRTDEFDMKYFKEQRELLIRAYQAIRFLRLILQNHPKADKSKIPDWLYKGDIWTY
ncbi:MAG: family ATPase [Candidatus Saccharibacteria bacterium]|nr:family ATPase [Candidatus Saccharibacteria bacterium]